MKTHKYYQLIKFKIMTTLSKSFRIDKEEKMSLDNFMPRPEEENIVFGKEPLSPLSSLDDLVDSVFLKTSKKRC